MDLPHAFVEILDFCKLSHRLVKIDVYIYGFLEVMDLSSYYLNFFKIYRWNSVRCNVDLSRCYIHLYPLPNQAKLKFDRNLKLVASAVDLNLRCLWKVPTLQRLDL